MGLPYTSSSIHSWCLMAGGWLLVPAVIVLSSFHSVQTVDINAAAFQLPPPPFLTGNLATNNILAEAERLHEGVVSTPGSFVVVGDAVFTVTRDGHVVNIAPCRPVVLATLSPRGCRTPKECGYLIGIRLNADKLLLVLDAYRGLFEVNTKTGVFRHVYDSSTVVNGRASVYLNDMALMADGTVIMTDSSPTFDFANEFWIRFEGRPDGRLLGFNPTSGQVKEILAGLAYPTGLEITSDGQALLVAEAGRARIARLELSKEKFFHKSIMNVNLPGMPEHIRKTKRGTYWVGLTYPRYQGDVSIMDQYSNSAGSRNFLAKRRHMEQLMLMYTRKGLAVELDTNGKVVSSIHDADGLRVKDVCEVTEADGILYVGTRDQHTVLRVLKYPVDVTMTSALQILRSRCQVMDEQLNVAKAAMEQQILAQKGIQAEGSVLSTILTGNNFNVVFQNYQRQQQLAHAAGSQAARPPAPRLPTAPRSRLDTIRQGLAQLQHSLLRPSNNRGAALPPNMNNRLLPGQNHAPQLPLNNDDPFIPLGMSPSNFVTPPRNIPQSDTSVPGRNVGPSQNSPSSPLVVHRMENGQLVTHVLLGNDFKVQDHTAQTTTTTTLKPTPADRWLAFNSYTPTPPTFLRTSGSLDASQAGRYHVMSQNSPGSSGGFFDFLNGLPAQAKGKENFPIDDSTPVVPLPDHAPVIPAENPYYLGLSHSEAHNNTPSEYGGAGHANNASSSGKVQSHFEHTFQPSDKVELLHQGGHITQPPLPQNFAKTAMLRHGFQMLQQYFKQTRQTQPLPQVTEPTVKSDGASQGHGNFSDNQNAGGASFRNHSAAEQSVSQAPPNPGRNQEVYSTVPSLEKSREFTAINEMVKRDQQLSFSGAAAIHPNQPINDVSPGELSPKVNEFPSSMPATSVQRARARQPVVEIATEGGEGGAPNSYIKIVQGPGKYILIPLTQTTLLQALRGVASKDGSGDQIVAQAEADRMVSQTEHAAGIPEQLAWSRNDSTRQGRRGQTEQPIWASESSPRRHWSAHIVNDFSGQQPGESGAPHSQVDTQNWPTEGNTRPGVNEMQQHNGPRDSSMTAFNQQPYHSESRAREGTAQDSLHGRIPQQNWREDTRTTPSRVTDNRHVGRAPYHPSEFTDAPPNEYPTSPLPQNNWPSDGSQGPARSSSNNHGQFMSRDRWDSNIDHSNNRPSDHQPNQPWQSPRPRYENDPPTPYRPNHNQPRESWPDNNHSTRSWSTNNRNHDYDRPPQAWTANSRSGESWPNNNQPEQSWSPNNQPTQSWRTNNPPTPPWSNDNHHTQSWATKNPPTQSWSRNNQPESSWPTDNPQSSSDRNHHSRSWPGDNGPAHSWQGGNNPGHSWPANDTPPQSWARNNFNNSESSSSWQTGNTGPRRGWSSHHSETPGNAYAEEYVTPTRSPHQHSWGAHTNPSQPFPITDFPSAPTNQAPPTANPQQTWSSGSRQDANSTSAADHTPSLRGHNDSYSLNDQNSQHLQDQAYVTQWQV